MLSLIESLDVHVILPAHLTCTWHECIYSFFLCDNTGIWFCWGQNMSGHLVILVLYAMYIYRIYRIYFIA
jgi:hypothetical protein